MKQNRLNFLASLVSLVVLSLGLVSAPLLTLQAADDNLLDSQIGLDQVGEQFGAEDEEDQNLVLVIVRIINVTLSVLGLIVLVLIIFSGYQWMTAGGNEDQIKTAKQRMSNALIGLLIVLMAFAITQFVFYRVVLPSTTGEYYAPWF